MLQDLTDGQLDEIRLDNGWFVFAVVRHPSSRLWSAWQSKFLLAEPRFQALFPDAPWPRIPRTTAELVEDFTAFVDAMDGQGHARLFHDRHFRQQTRLLRIDETPYSRVYRTSEIGLLLQELENHLRPLGLESMPALRRSNETPLRPIRALFTRETVDIISKQYASDFDYFGFTDVVPPSLYPQDEYSNEALGEIRRLVERAERIDDLHDAVMRVRAARAKAEAEVKMLRTQLQPAPGKSSPRATARKPRQALARLRRRTRKLFRVGVSS
jgi:hypothetical protein